MRGQKKRVNYAKNKRKINRTYFAGRFNEVLDDGIQLI